MQRRAVMEAAVPGEAQVVRAGVTGLVGSGSVCDASQRYTLTPWPMCVLSFSFYAWSRLHRATRFPHTILLRLLLLQLHLLVPSAPRPFSLTVAAALSNGRCNIQRLLAVTRGGGSLGWLLLASSRCLSPKKKSPTWPEPRTVKLAPLSINRCASNRLSFALLTCSSFLPSPSFDASLSLSFLHPFPRRPFDHRAFMRTSAD